MKFLQWFASLYYLIKNKGTNAAQGHKEGALSMVEMRHRMSWFHDGLVLFVPEISMCVKDALIKKSDRMIAKEISHKIVSASVIKPAQGR